MLLGLAIAGHIATARCDTPRTRFTEEHILKIAELGKGKFSPDGRLLAVEEIRPLEQARIYDDSLHFVQGNTVLWIFDVQSKEGYAVNVPGAFGVAAGPWSPDSKKLLVYSFSLPDAASRGVSLGVWNAEKRSYRRLPETPAYVTSFYRVTAAWLSDEEVVYSALAAGYLSREDVNGMSKRGAMQLVEKWKRTWTGREPSYGVLESGSPLVAARRETGGRLLRVDIESRATETLAEGDYNAFLFPPDKRFLIAERNGPAFVALADGRKAQPGDDHLFRSLVRIDLRGRRPPVPLTANFDVLSYLVDFVTLSPNGEKLAFYANETGESFDEAKLYVYDLQSERLQPLRQGPLGTNSVHWLHDIPVVLTPSGLWRLSTDQDPIQIATELEQPITELQEHADRLLAIAGGSLWQLSATEAPRKLAPGMNVSLAGFADLRLPADASSLLVRTSESRQSGPVLLDLEDQTLKVLPAPPRGSLVHLAADASHLLYEVTDFDGKRFVLLNGATGERKRLLAVNQWRSAIEFAGRKMISYSLPGRENEPPLIGQVLTPPDYQSGHRYPVVVNAYGGATYGALPPETVPDALPYGHFYNDQVLAASGYVVLRPSLPIDRSQEPLDVPEQLAAGVLAAVDALIEDGIADPDRLAIMGHSFGGYTTLAVLTRTNRFKAAIASAGVYNVTSAYSSFAPSIRGEPYVHANNFNPALWIEAAQPGMGAPPWESPDEYIRNSPLFRADRISTPVLFLHGDLDSWSITQSEEMFNALYRQGKRARFARFWGEQHGLFSPANIRQAWTEIKQWLDATMK